MTVLAKRKENPLLAQVKSVFDGDEDDVSQRNKPKGKGLRAYFMPITGGARAGLIKLSAIKERPGGQVRTRSPSSDNGFAELVSSIQEKGVLQPIAATWSEKDDCFWLDYGHRRVAAAKAASLEAIPAVIKSNGEQIEEEIPTLTEHQLIENLHRLDLPPLDVARAIQTLSEAGLSGAEIGRRLGKSRSWVSKHLKLLRLPEHLLIKAEELNVGHEALYQLQSADIGDQEKDRLFEVAAQNGRHELTRQLEKRAVSLRNKKAKPSAETKSSDPQRALNSAMKRVRKHLEHLCSLLEQHDHEPAESVRLNAENLFAAMDRFRSETSEMKG